MRCDSLFLKADRGTETTNHLTRPSAGPTEAETPYEVWTEDVAKREVDIQHEHVLSGEIQCGNIARGRRAEAHLALSGKRHPLRIRFALGTSGRETQRRVPIGEADARSGHVLREARRPRPSVATKAEYTWVESAERCARCTG